jgi:hypothetical protein
LNNFFDPEPSGQSLAAANKYIFWEIFLKIFWKKKPKKNGDLSISE